MEIELLRLYECHHGKIIDLMSAGSILRLADLQITFLITYTLMDCVYMTDSLTKCFVTNSTCVIAFPNEGVMPNIQIRMLNFLKKQSLTKNKGCWD